MSKKQNPGQLVYSTANGDLRKAAPKSNIVDGSATAKDPVRVKLDTKGRRGKAVTIVSGIQHNPQVIEDLARSLKNLCGAGGTVEGRDILVQGDHCDKVIARLQQLGYTVKRG